MCPSFFLSVPKPHLQKKNWRNHCPGRFIEFELEPDFSASSFISSRVGVIFLRWAIATRITVTHATVIHTRSHLAPPPILFHVWTRQNEPTSRTASFFFFFLEPSTDYIYVRTKAKTCRCTITLSAINAMLRGVNATTEQSRALIDF